MILLIDFDSILYTSVYKIVGIGAIRDALEKYGKEGAKQWFLEEVLNEGVNRCENELLKIQNYVDSQILEDVTGVELFITTCSKSFRKELAPTYKSSRKKNNYVWMLRSHYQMSGAHFSDTLEADDLIAIRAKELGKDNCIVISIDKDLKQIGGYYWSYYKTRSKDNDGNFIMNDFGFYDTEYKQKTVAYITDEEADTLFWGQMLTGDSGDDIKGLHRVGIKTAEKILLNTNCNWFAVAREYIKRNQKQDFKLNYKLLRLVDNGVINN
jgi:5'-3' exonuclease